MPGGVDTLDRRQAPSCGDLERLPAVHEVPLQFEKPEPSARQMEAMRGRCWRLSKSLAKWGVLRELAYWNAHAREWGHEVIFFAAATDLFRCLDDLTPKVVS